MTEAWWRNHNQGPSSSHFRIGNAHTVARLRVLNARLHQSAPRTAQTRTGSPTPLSDCSPRSSKRAPADVRASERTVSETSTSPGTESPLPRGDVHGAAVDVVVLADHVARVETEVEGEARVVSGCPASKRGFDGLASGREHREDAVA